MYTVTLILNIAYIHQVKESKQRTPK